MSDAIKKNCNMYINMDKHLPINAITINSQNYLVLVVCDRNFERHIVVLNEKGNIIKTLLDTDDDSIKLARDNTHLYIASSTHNHSKLYKYDLDELCLVETRSFPFADMGSVSVNNDNIYLFDAKEGYIHELNKDLKTNRKLDVNEYNDKRHGHSFNYIAATNEGFTSIGLPGSEEEFYKLKAFLSYKFGENIGNSNDYIKSVAYDKKNNVGYISFQNFIIVMNDKGIDGILDFKKKSIVSLTYDDIDTDSLVICFGGNKPLTGNVKVINKEMIDKLKLPINNKKSEKIKGFLNKKPIK